MSGYSDKEYLKSAIHLKAISYVEKPIDLYELEDSLKTAVSEVQKSKILYKNIKNNITITPTIIFPFIFLIFFNKPINIIFLQFN